MTAGSPTAPSHDKARLRQQLKQRLAALSTEERAAKSRQVCGRLEALPLFQRSRGVLLCLSFGVEVDTWPLARRLVAEGLRRVFVPRCEKGDPELAVCPFPCELTQLSFGLQQPAASVPGLPPESVAAEVDCALILGLGFDPESRIRLGYGRGYFDRFLARCDVPGIGLAFETQLVTGLPREPHDVPLSAVVTEAAVY